MKSRLGTAAALTATAHKLARIVYLALKHGLSYVRKSQQEYEAQMKEKQIKALKRKVCRYRGKTLFTLAMRAHCKKRTPTVSPSISRETLFTLAMRAHCKKRTSRRSPMSADHSLRVPREACPRT
jgi:hypothetical protein